MLRLLKVLAFIKRDYRIESSYKLSFLLEISTSILPVFTFYFIGKLVAGGDNPHLEPYGGDYFAFALVGIALTQYFMSALRIFATSVRRAQTTGVLEAILSTQTSPQQVILYSSAYSFVASTLHVAVVFGVGGLLLGADYSHVDLLSVFVTLVLTIAAFSGLGLLSATAIVILKKGDPIELLLGSTSSLLGGAFFPVAVMPEWLQMLAKALPITHALEAMRLALFAGRSVAELWLELTVLAAMALVLLPGSLWAFDRAVEKGRREGSLIQY